MPRAKAFDPELALDRAVEVFWRLGYEGASMAKLLEFMGISRQSLYDTYGDKHSLFLAAVDRYRDGIRAQLVERLAGQAPALDEIRDVFDWATREIFEHPHHRSCLMANAALELGQRDPEVRERVAAHLRDIEGVFQSALERGQQAGEFGSARNTQALARFLTTSINGLGVLARAGAPSPVLHDSIATTLAAIAH